MFTYASHGLPTKVYHTILAISGPKFNAVDASYSGRELLQIIGMNEITDDSDGSAAITIAAKRILQPAPGRQRIVDVERGGFMDAVLTLLSSDLPGIQRRSAELPLKATIDVRNGTRIFLSIDPLPLPVEVPGTDFLGRSNQSSASFTVTSPNITWSLEGFNPGEHITTTCPFASTDTCLERSSNEDRVRLRINIDTRHGRWIFDNARSISSITHTFIICTLCNIGMLAGTCDSSMGANEVITLAEDHFERLHATHTDPCPVANLFHCRRRFYRQIDAWNHFLTYHASDLNCHFSISENPAVSADLIITQCNNCNARLPNATTKALLDSFGCV